jgi:toxin FitB
MIVLDTNVLSELLRTEPARQVLRWMSAVPSVRLFTTAINQAEILFGVELLPAGSRRSALAVAAAAMFTEDFDGRVLPFDGGAARQFAELAAARRCSGRPIPEIDAQIAAITRSHGAKLATRNVEDFAHCGIDLVDPWRG